MQRANQHDDDHDFDDISLPLRRKSSRSPKGSRDRSSRRRTESPDPPSATVEENLLTSIDILRSRNASTTPQTIATVPRNYRSRNNLPNRHFFEQGRSTPSISDIVREARKPPPRPPQPPPPQAAQLDEMKRESFKSRSRFASPSVNDRKGGGKNRKTSQSYRKNTPIPQKTRNKWKGEYDWLCFKPETFKAKIDPLEKSEVKKNWKRPVEEVWSRYLISHDALHKKLVGLSKYRKKTIIEIRPDSSHRHEFKYDFVLEAPELEEDFIEGGDGRDKKKAELIKQKKLYDAKKQEFKNHLNALKKLKTQRPNVNENEAASNIDMHCTDCRMKFVYMHYSDLTSITTNVPELKRENVDKILEVMREAEDFDFRDRMRRFGTVMDKNCYRSDSSLLSWIFGLPATHCHQTSLFTNKGKHHGTKPYHLQAVEENSKRAFTQSNVFANDLVAFGSQKAEDVSSQQSDMIGIDIYASVIKNNRAFTEVAERLDDLRRSLKTLNQPEKAAGIDPNNSFGRSSYPKARAAVEALYQYVTESESYQHMIDSRIASLMYDETSHMGKAEILIMKGFISPKTNKRVIAPLDLKSVRGRMTGKNVSKILLDVLKNDTLRTKRGTADEKGDFDYLDSQEPLFTWDHPPYRALGFDGCKVNTGVHNGVNTNIEKETGLSFFKIHCVPHRVNILNRRLLTSKNMRFRCEGFISTMKVIDEAFNLIKYSQVNNSIFHSIQELMGLKAYEVIRIPNSRFEYAYNQALRCKVRVPEIIDTLIQIRNDQKNQTKKAEISGILSRFLTPQFHYRLDIIVNFLKPLRYLSKLTQTRDALASEVYNQIRITRRNLTNMKKDTKTDEIANAKIENMMWEYVRNVKDEQGDLKKVRTKVKMQQLRSRNQKEPAELKADRLIFQDKIYKQCEEILDDLFPRNSLEHKLSALDLINIVDTDEPTPDENHAIEILATSLFQGSEVTLSNGRKIQFRPLYGDIEEARIEWIREGRDTVKEIAKKMMSLPDYDDSKSVVKKQMKEAAIMNENELDEIKWKYENSRSIVGISDEEFKEMYEEMATHAKKLNKVEEKKFEDEMEKFVHQGNITLDFDPSDIEDDADANENIEEEADAIDDVMGDDDLELLQKFYLTSAEMQDDEKISGRKKRRISQADIWATIMKELRISTPSLAKVIELMLVIPSSTAEVERFFKVLKEMKSKKRNRLSAKKLRKMFMIFHFLDLENYDKERVFEIFQQKLSR